MTADWPRFKDEPCQGFPIRLNCLGVIEKCFLKVLQKCALSLNPVS